MNEIDVLKSNIADATQEIELCGEAITQIDNMDIKLSNVVLNLGYAASALEKGLIICGKPATVEPINKRKESIAEYQKKLLGLKTILEGIITNKENSIETWNDELKILESANGKQNNINSALWELLKKIFYK